MPGNFKMIFLIAFIAAAMFGVMVFSGLIPLGGSNDDEAFQGTVTLWGTASRGDLDPILNDFNSTNKTFEVRYVQKLPESFNQDLLEALASGVGPDLFFLSNELAFSYSDKIYTIPFSNFPLINFKNTYATAGEVFLTDEGILAFPLTIDPLMMYYNRSILDTNNIVYPPKNWEELSTMSKLITKRDESKQIVKSGVALGQFSNISNAKDIISALFMQVGSPITSQTGYGRFGANLIAKEGEFSILDPVLDFYISFANPLVDTYSWNKSLPQSRDFFSADNSAFYFGFASELPILINKNPNQNFAVAPLPQIKNTNTKVTSARVTGIAVSAFSKNFNTAYNAASILSSSTFAKEYADMLGVAPARRDLLAVTTSEDTYFPVFYSSALFARSWLDPSPRDTNNIYRLMVESILSNTSDTEESIRNAENRMNILFNK